MKRASGGRAVPKTYGSDGILNLLKSPSDQHAVDHRNHRSQMADHRQQTFSRPSAMNIAFAPAHRSQGRAHIGAHSIDNGFTKRQTPRSIADQGRKDISFEQGHSCCGADSLLAFAKKDAAVDLATAIQACHLLIENTRLQHETKCLHALLAKTGNGIGYSPCVHYLNHLPLFMKGLCPSRKPFLCA